MPRTLSLLAQTTLFIGVSAQLAIAGGVPQLDPTWYPSQLFWLFITFFAMLILVRGSIAPNIANLLEHRKSSIETAIKEAESYRAQANQADEDMATAIHSAKADASHIIQTVQNEIDEHAAENLQTLDQDLKVKLVESEHRLNASKDSAMDELQEHAADIAKSIVEKLLHSDIDSSDALNVTRRVS